MVSPGFDGARPDALLALGARRQGDSLPHHRNGLESSHTQTGVSAAGRELEPNRATHLAKLQLLQLWRDASLVLLPGSALRPQGRNSLQGWRVFRLPHLLRTEVYEPADKLEKSTPAKADTSSKKAVGRAKILFGSLRVR